VKKSSNPRGREEASVEKVSCLHSNSYADVKQKSVISLLRKKTFSGNWLSMDATAWNSHSICF